MTRILSEYSKSVHPDRLALQTTPDDARRPDPHARRNAVRHTFPANPTPVPTPVPADASDAPASDACLKCGGSGLDDSTGEEGEQVWCSHCEGSGFEPADAPPTLGQLAAGSPYIPDAPDCVPPAYASDWLSDSGRNELASVPALCERIEREAPGVAVRVAVSFAVSRLPCGTVHFDHRPAWEVTAWRGTEAFNESGFDLEQLAARAAAKFRAAAGKEVAP